MATATSPTIRITSVAARRAFEGNEVSEDQNVPLKAKQPIRETRAKALVSQIIVRTHELHALIGLNSDDITDWSDDRLVQTYCQFAKTMLLERRDRNLVLSAELLGDPAWDMLLDLFVAGDNAKSVSVTSLCHASGVPPSTALRWIGLLVGVDLIERVNDPDDGRRVNVTLAIKGRASLCNYLEVTAVRRGITLENAK